MRYYEVNVFGVYIAPIVPMLLLAWIAMVPLRSVAHRVGIYRHVWHPALFSFALYLILLAAIVLAAGTLASGELPSARLMFSVNTLTAAGSRLPTLDAAAAAPGARLPTLDAAAGA